MPLQTSEMHITCLYGWRAHVLIDCRSPHVFGYLAIDFGISRQVSSHTTIQNSLNLTNGYTLYVALS